MEQTLRCKQHFIVRCLDTNANNPHRNGHYTLAGFLVIGIVVVLFQRISLEAFGPYVPFSVALSLLATVHVVPWIKTFFQQRNGITLGEYIIATGGYHPEGSAQAAVDPTSVRSIGGFHIVPDRGWNSDPFELQHMHLSGQYQTTARAYSPDHSSSFDLESGLPHQAQSSTASAGSRQPFL
jgi:hypothetical protein